MEYKELFLSAIQALKANIMRTLLTMLGIIIGISSVILIVSIGQGTVNYVTNELSMFGTNFFQINPGSSVLTNFAGGERSITLDDVDAIRKDTSLTNIQTVGAFATTSKVISANDIDKTMFIYGATPEIGEILKPTMEFGEFFTQSDELESKRVVVIGGEVAETFFGEGANPIGEKIKIGQRTFEIIGVATSGSVLFGSFFDNALFTPLNTMLDEIESNSYIREVDIGVYDVNLMNDTMNQVTELLRDRHNLKIDEENDFIALSATDAISTVQNITNILTAVIAAISAISLIVGGVGVMNIMLVSVTERTREIGLLKAIGAEEKVILLQFLIEAIVMTVIGGAIGIAFGFFGAFLISLFVKIPFSVNLWAVIIAVGVSMLVGIIFGYYPARRAARLSPIDALRYE